MRAADNAANNLAAREHGLLPLLVTLLAGLQQQRSKRWVGLPAHADACSHRTALGCTLLGNEALRQATAQDHYQIAQVSTPFRPRFQRSDEPAVDDSGPLAGAALDALLAAARGSRGSCEALVALGVQHPLSGLLAEQGADHQLRTAAARWVGGWVGRWVKSIAAAS